MNSPAVRNKPITFPARKGAFGLLVPKKTGACVRKYLREQGFRDKEFAQTAFFAEFVINHKLICYFGLQPVARYGGRQIFRVHVSSHKTKNASQSLTKQSHMQLLHLVHLWGEAQASEPKNPKKPSKSQSKHDSLVKVAQELEQFHRGTNPIQLGNIVDDERYYTRTVHNCELAKVVESFANNGYLDTSVIVVQELKDQPGKYLLWDGVHRVKAAWLMHNAAQQGWGPETTMLCKIVGKECPHELLIRYCNIVNMTNEVTVCTSWVDKLQSMYRYSV